MALLRGQERRASRDPLGCLGWGSSRGGGRTGSRILGSAPQTF